MTFPLVPRGRLVGLSFGTMRSLRRGAGSDVAGSRPYHTGDDMHAIDWAASARLSLARQEDAFIVRERFAEEAPRVVVVADRRPAMAGLGAELPWLHKPLAVRRAIELVLDSTALVGGFAGYLDLAGGDAWWLPPVGGRRLGELREDRLADEAFDGPEDSIARSLEYLTHHPRAVTPGTFVFCFSDYLDPPPQESWLTAIEHRWDVVPVIVQDPVWEQSFPDVNGIVVPLRDPRTGRMAEVRVTRKEAARRRAANEARLARLLDAFETIDLDPLVVSADDEVGVLASFIEWADLRRGRRAA
jgi:uncharacterized protein (DUF58 family)